MRYFSKLIFLSVALLASSPNAHSQKWLGTTLKILNKMANGSGGGSTSGTSGSRGSSSSSGAGVTTDNSLGSPIKIVNVHPDLKVRVARCAASGRTLTIDLVFTNASTEDIDIFVSGGYYDSSAYDTNGNMYTKDALEVKAASDARYNSYTKRPLIAGVPTKVSVEIRGVPATAEAIAVLNLILRSQVLGINSKGLQIRNIPISRD